MFTLFVASQNVLEFSGETGQFVDCLLGLLRAHRSPGFGEVEGEQIKSGELRGEGLGGGYSNLRTGVGVNRAGSFARDHRTDHVADGQRLRSLSFGFTLRRDGVGSLARLRNYHGQRVRADDRVAITPF